MRICHVCGTQVSIVKNEFYGICESDHKLSLLEIQDTDKWYARKIGDVYTIFDRGVIVANGVAKVYALKIVRAINTEGE